MKYFKLSDMEMKWYEKFHITIVVTSTTVSISIIVLLKSTFQKVLGSTLKSFYNVLLFKKQIKLALQGTFCSHKH